jgi:hypothetical protein
VSEEIQHPHHRERTTVPSSLSAADCGRDKSHASGPPSRRVERSSSPRSRSRRRVCPVEIEIGGVRSEWTRQRPNLQPLGLMS